MYTNFAVNIEILNSTSQILYQFQYYQAPSEYTFVLLQSGRVMGLAGETTPFCLVSVLGTKLIFFTKVITPPHTALGAASALHFELIAFPL